MSLDNHQTLLVKACEKGNREQVLSLIGKEVDINAVTQNGCTPLIIATKNRHYGVVYLLLQAGVDRNSIDSKGFTALHYAAGLGYTYIAHLLLDHGAICLKSDGITPLTLACYNGRLLIVDLLYNDYKIPTTRLEGLEAMLVTQTKDVLEYLCHVCDIKCDLKWTSEEMKREVKKQIENERSKKK